MARFVLQPVKIRDNTFVPVKDSLTQDLDWPLLIRKLVPPGRGRGQALTNLRGMSVGAVVGTVRSSRDGEPIPFLFFNNDRTGNARWALKRDRSFETRLIEAYRVEALSWDDHVIEGNVAPEAEAV